jgi:hypothetical protein
MVAVEVKRLTYLEYLETPETKQGYGMLITGWDSP